MSQIEWMIEWLAGNARSCVRRVKSISVEQLVKAQRAACKYGVSAEDCAATILKAVSEVPNPDPDKLTAVRALFA